MLDGVVKQKIRVQPDKSHENVCTYYEDFKLKNMAVKLDTAEQTHCINVLNVKNYLIFIPKRMNRWFFIHQPFSSNTS